MPERIGSVIPVDGPKKIGDRLFKQQQEQAKQKKEGDNKDTQNRQITDKVEISRWKK